MRSTYKKLGPYIREIDVRNTEGAEDGLLGLSVSKTFLPTKANTIGTNFSNYKIVMRGQFSYTADTSRRGDKIAIALLDQWARAMVSPIYTVFEIVDEEQLLPEYLMMWFRRPEFDRYARFKSHGSVRELFGWEEMCDVELPIPSIEKQRGIVKEYQTVVDRIRLNERLNEKLEEAAQAIYKQWFVDFEFPMPADYAQSIGKPDLAGRPYKSSGGEMECNDVLEQEVPKGWRKGTIGDIASVSSGKAPPTRFNSRDSSNNVPIVGAGSVMGYAEKSLIDGRVLIIGRVGTHGVVQRLTGRIWPTDNTLVFKSARFEYLFHVLKHLNYDELNRGGVQGLITQTDLKHARTLTPPADVQNEFEVLAGGVLSVFDLNIQLKNSLGDLRDVLLSRLATVQDDV